MRALPVAAGIAEGGSYATGPIAVVKMLLDNFLLAHVPKCVRFATDIALKPSVLHYMNRVALEFV